MKKRIQQVFLMVGLVAILMLSGCQNYGFQRPWDRNLARQGQWQVFECLSAVIEARHHEYCNNHDLQRWEQWKAQSPNVAQNYERDLYSGRIYRKGECPRNTLHVWCQ